MYIRIYNAKNDSFYLVGRPSDVADPGFVTTNIDGLTDLAASLSTISNAGIDGDVVSSSKLMPRTINIFLTLHPTSSASIDGITNTLKRAFPLKSTASLEWEREDETVLTISGIVESIARPRFGDGTPARTMQISLYCSVPLFSGAAVTSSKASTTSSAPLAMTNAGEYPVGIEITLENTYGDSIEVPSVTVEYGMTSEVIELNKRETFADEKTVIINTKKGEKKYIVDGEDNTAYVSTDSTWFQIPPGDFDVYADTENVSVSVTITPRYL